MWKWKKARQPGFKLPDPTSHGWRLNEHGELEPLWLLEGTVLLPPQLQCDPCKCGKTSKFAKAHIKDGNKDGIEPTAKACTAATCPCKAAMPPRKCTQRCRCWGCNNPHGQRPGGDVPGVASGVDSDEVVEEDANNGHGAEPGEGEDEDGEETAGADFANVNAAADDADSSGDEGADHDGDEDAEAAALPDYDEDDGSSADERD